MNTIRISGIRSFMLAAIFSAFSVSLGFVSPVFAYTSVIVNPDGKVTYLGTLGGTNSTAFGINDSGQVAGWAQTRGVGYGSLQHAFITGPHGAGMTLLSALDGSSYSVAFDINATGQVVGERMIVDERNSFFHSFITGPDGVGMTHLGALGPGPEGPYSLATGINAAGHVVGVSTTGGDLRHASRAFITGPDGVGMTDLGTLGGDHSYAYDINDSGQVVGVSQTENGSSHAFITGPNGMGMTDLGTLGGDSRAYGINEAGRVVGESLTAKGVRHAFITGPDGVGMTDLGTLGGDLQLRHRHQR